MTVLQKKALQQIKKIEQIVKKNSAPVFEINFRIFQNPYQILVGVLLSSRTRDEVTISAAEKLFSRAKSFSQLAEFSAKEISALIYPVGFYKVKGKQLSEIARRLKDQNSIPSSLQELQQLPGIGIKSASLILQLAFGKEEIAVDTHVKKIAQRLGWTNFDKPEKISIELKNLFPRTYYSRINLLLVAFGQTICLSRHPRCSLCPLTKACLYFKTLTSSENKSPSTD